MDVSASICPVPSEQLPINEYNSLRESWFFRWAALDLGGYLKAIGWVWSLGWILSGPVAAASFSPAKHPGQFVLLGAGGASLLLFLILLRLYSGWFYIQNRLTSITVFYEETGWYDGQTWEKPPEVLTQDRLISTYQVQPMLRRLHQTFGVLGASFIGGSLAWSLL